MQAVRFFNTRRNCMATFTIALAVACLSTSASARVCKQGAGRLCTDQERSHPYLNTSMAGVVSLPDSATISRSSKFANYGFRSYTSTLPAVVPYGGSIFAVFRMTGTCESKKPCKLCPDNSLYAVKDCKTAPHTKYMQFHFAAYAKLDSMFGIDGEVKSLPFDTQYDAFKSSYYDLKRTSTHHYGIDDMRVFTWDDGVYLAMVDRRLDTQQRTFAYAMMVQHIFTSTSESPVEMHFDTVSASELQWTAIDQIYNNSTGRNDYLFTRSIEPHQIIQCSHDGQCIEAAITSHATYFKQLSERRGGLAFKAASNAVRVNDKYYGAIVSGVPYDKASGVTVQHYAYMFEAKHPWSIVKVARQPLQLPTPICQKHRICQAHVTGLTFVDGKLVISYHSESELDNLKFMISAYDVIFSDMDRLSRNEFVPTNEIVLHAQAHYVSALVEGAQHVNQGARLNRVVEQHLSSMGQADKDEGLTVFICGMESCHKNTVFN